MDFIMKDIYNDKGTLVVKKGAVIDDILLVRLRSHGIKRLAYDEINSASVAEPISQLVHNYEVKSDLMQYLDLLPSTMYNQAKYTSAVARILGEWLGLEQSQLDDLTVLAMFHKTGIEIDLQKDPKPYEAIMEVAYTYSTFRNRDRINVLIALDKMRKEYIALLNQKILLTFLKKMSDTLKGSVIEINNKKYKIVYLQPNDFVHPLIEDLETNTVKEYDPRK